MMTFSEFLVEEEKYGWLDHNHKFRRVPTKLHYTHGKVVKRFIRRFNKPLAHRMASDGTRNPLDTYDAEVHAVKKGWTKVYVDHDGTGVAQYDSRKLKDPKTHRKALRNLGKKVKRYDIAKDEIDRKYVDSRKDLE